jgi:hypothetical protein
MKSVPGKIWRSLVVCTFFTVYMFFMGNLFANMLGATLYDLVKQMI